MAFGLSASALGSWQSQWRTLHPLSFSLLLFDSYPRSPSLFTFTIVNLRSIVAFNEEKRGTTVEECKRYTIRSRENVVSIYPDIDKMDDYDVRLLPNRF